MIVDIFGEKTEVSGLKDAFGLPLKYGDKVIAIDKNGFKIKAFYIGTTPSRATDKVLPLGSSYLKRPYRGVLKYDWKTSVKDQHFEQASIQTLRDNDPGVM